MLAAILLIAVLPATLAKFAIPIEKINDQLMGFPWDTTYRMANLAGPIAICENPSINAEQSGAINQDIATASAPEALLSTPEYTAKGFWYWVNSSGWDAESVSNDMSIFVSNIDSIGAAGDFSEFTNPVYGCSVEPYCEFADANPCRQTSSPAFCTLFVCMFTSYQSDSGRSRASKSRRDANFLPMLDGLPTTLKLKSLSLRDTYPRNATAYYNYLAQPNVRLQLAGNKDQEDIAKMIMDHFQCDAFLDPKANMENIAWDSVPNYKERNIDLMRRRNQLKPIFERVFVIDESEMSEEEKPFYREDTVIRLLNSIHRYANFVKMRFERVGCAYIPQCGSANHQEFPLAVMVCVTVQPYNGPTPPPNRRSTTAAPTAVSAETGATVEPLVLQTVEALQMTPAPTVEAEPLEEVDSADLVEDMNNQKS